MNVPLKKLEHCHGKTVQSTSRNEGAPGEVKFIFSDGSTLIFPDVFLEEEEQYIPEGYHIVEDADGERFVKNDVPKEVPKEPQAITKDDVGTLNLDVDDEHDEKTPEEKQG